MTDVRAVVLDILNDVTVDALVTVQHANEMADEIVAALDKRGLTITEATPKEWHDDGSQHIPEGWHSSGPEHRIEPLTICPGCGAVATIVRGEPETVHDDECDWFHGPDRAVPDVE